MTDAQKTHYPPLVTEPILRSLVVSEKNISYFVSLSQWKNSDAKMQTLWVEVPSATRGGYCKINETTKEGNFHIP